MAFTGFVEERYKCCKVSLLTVKFLVEHYHRLKYFKFQLEEKLTITNQCYSTKVKD